MAAERAKLDKTSKDARVVRDYYGLHLEKAPVDHSIVEMEKLMCNIAVMLNSDVKLCRFTVYLIGDMSGPPENADFYLVGQRPMKTSDMTMGFFLSTVKKLRRENYLETKTYPVLVSELVVELKRTFPDINHKLVRAKARNLIRQGYLTGCYCGCRGDFELTSQGEMVAFIYDTMKADLKKKLDDQLMFGDGMGGTNLKGL